jgi:protoporphyrinogen oxidase
LSTVPMHWLEGKLPMPDVKKVIIDNILRKQETEMVHSTFYYPKKGGSQFIIDRLATNLEILNSHPVTQLQLNGKKWIVDGLHTFDAVVYTGDVRVLKTILTTDSQVLDTADAVRSLRSNGTSNLLCYTDDTDISWLYLPDAKTKAHRIIYTGNFSPENNTPNKRKTCVVEFSGKVSLDVMKEEIKNLPGNLEAIKSNYEPNSYVVQDKDTRVNIKKLKDQLSPLNFYLTGRFAEWEYYNMDKAIEASMNVANVYF